MCVALSEQSFYQDFAVAFVVGDLLSRQKAYRLRYSLIPIPNLNVAEPLIEASNRLDIIGCCNSLD